MQIALILALLAIPMASLADDTVAGLWLSDSSVLEVRVDGDALTGTVVAIRDPFYGPGETGAEGAPRLDDENPDPALRTRPVVGLSILLDFAWDGRRWQGRIYDPESGNTYQSRLKVNGDGELEIRGYIGSPMFGRTAIFEPASDCPEAAALMLAKSAVDDVCPVAAD